MSEFEVGDKIKVVTDETEKYHGREGDLVRIKDSDPHGYIYRLEFDNQYGTVGFKANEIKKVDNMSDFKPFNVKTEGPNHSRMLQEVAFEEGYTWRKGSNKPKNLSKDYLSFNLFENLCIGYSNGDAIKGDKSYDLRDFSIKEFRQALRGNYDWEDPIVVQGHEVEFINNEMIEVGCKCFHKDTIKASYKAVTYGLGDSSLSVQLHHDEVGEIPFEVVEAIYNRIKE